MSQSLHRRSVEMTQGTTSGKEPLMRTARLELDEDDEEEELTRFQLLVLTCTLGGLQVVWSILNGNVNVFLLSIGISPSMSPLIWVVAPLSGTLVQPVVGWLSDRTESKYGRRKPYVLVGTITTIIALMGLSYSQNAAKAITTASDLVSITTGITVAWVVLLNISIQPLQLGVRALVMDGCPKAQQPQANAWAGCAASIGNVVGYLVSFTTAATSIHVFGFGHFKYLAIIASICLSITVAITLTLSKDTSTQPPTTASNPSIILLLQHFRRSNLISSRTRIINRVQFCAWMGWFPFLFYMTAFISNLSTNSRNPTKTSQTGAFAGFLYALISCIASLLTPHLLRRTKFATAEIRAAPVATLMGLSLEEVWLIGQTSFGILMFATVFASTPTVGIIIIACAGIPWALANYIPFALIGIEVAEQKSLHEAAPSNDLEPEAETSSSSSGSSSTLDAEEPTRISEAVPATVSFGTGATIGLHNAAISAPQIFAALISAGVLALCKRLNSDDGVGWVMRLSGIAACVAAWQVKRLFHQ